jgi:phenylpropionate dioxygenase-like ring-hydroxylating dioxygenase large terminal subunit
MTPGNDVELIEKYWHFGCHISELKQEGDYLLYRLLDREVALYHDGRAIIAFDNRCPHRGTRLFDDRSGSAAAVCKYHGWSYSRGMLNIPQEEDLLPSCARPELHLYQTAWCGTFLFFSMLPTKPLDDQLGEDLYTILESLSFDCSSCQDNNGYVYDCYWPIAVENALEPQHLPFVHAATLNKFDLVNYRNRHCGKNSIVYFDIADPGMEKGLRRIERIYDCGDAVHAGYMSIFLFPFSFISSTAGTSYSVQTFFPKNEHSTWFGSRLYSVRLIDSKHQAMDEAVVAAAIDMNKKVFEEDHAICRRIERDAWVKSLNGPLYRSEEKIIQFRKYLGEIR